MLWPRSTRRSFRRARRSSPSRRSWRSTASRRSRSASCPSRSRATPATRRRSPSGCAGRCPPTCARSTRNSGSCCRTSTGTNPGRFRFRRATSSMAAGRSGTRAAIPTTPCGRNPPRPSRRSVSFQPSGSVPELPTGGLVVRMVAGVFRPRATADRRDPTPGVEVPRAGDDPVAASGEPTGPHRRRAGSRPAAQSPPPRGSCGTRP